MKINSVDMDVMAVRRSQYPSDSLPEFLLIGKSNVGKSSFINSILSFVAKRYFGFNPAFKASFIIFILSKKSKEQDSRFCFFNSLIKLLLAFCII